MTVLAKMGARIMGKVLRRALTRLLVVLLLAWLGLCAWVYFGQRGLLFHPQQLSMAQAQVWARDSGATALLDAQGGVLAWQFRPAVVEIGAAPAATCAGNWLMAHGNGGMALQRAFIADHLRKQLGDSTCLTVIEYPGFGAAAGTPSRSALMDQAQATLAALRVQIGAAPLFLIGESLGTGVVAELVQQHPDQIAGVLLLTPYDDLAAVAQGHFPWLPVRWLLSDGFVPIQALASYPGPVQLVVAGADQVIPPAHALRLAAALRNAQVRVEAGLDHNDLELRPAWWSQVQSLVARAEATGH